jgi:hypothetical protein
VFLGYNLNFTYGGSSPDDCFTAVGCALFAGVHGAFVNGPPLKSPQPFQSVNTYAFASFDDYGDLVPSFVNTHLISLSHELLEWLYDPIGINVYPNQKFGLNYAASLVPAWTSPYWSRGCSQGYEVADPLEDGSLQAVPNGSRFDLFADIVFHSWFARESISTSIFGLYDTGGVFKGPSPSCP